MSHYDQERDVQSPAVIHKLDRVRKSGMLDLWIRPDRTAVLEPAGTRKMQEQRELLDGGYTKARVVTFLDRPPIYEVCGRHKEAFVSYAREHGCLVEDGRDIHHQLIADHLNLLAAKAMNPACAVNEALQVYGGVARASDYIELRAQVARFFTDKRTESVDVVVDKIVAAGTEAQQRLIDGACTKCRK